MNFKKMRTFLRTAEIVIQAAAMLDRRFSAGFAATSLANLALDYVEPNPKEYFEQGDWDRVKIQPSVLSKVASCCYLFSVSDDEMYKAELFKTNTNLGILSGGFGEYYLYVRSGFNGLEEVSKAVWGNLESDYLHMAMTIDGKVEVNKDKISESKPSPYADDIVRSLRPFLNRDHSRAILIYGDKGTGKSNIVKEITKKLNFRSVRVCATDLSVSQDIVQMISILKPDVLILDDMCRCKDPSKLIDLFEALKKDCRLVLATANYLQGLDPAVRRAGRFDEEFEVNQAPEALVRQVMQDWCQNDELMEVALGLSLAQLNEFKLRLSYLGEEGALKWVAKENDNGRGET